MLLGIRASLHAVEAYILQIEDKIAAGESLATPSTPYSSQGTIPYASPSGASSSASLIPSSPIPASRSSNSPTTTPPSSVPSDSSSSSAASSLAVSSTPAAAGT